MYTPITVPIAVPIADETTPTASVTSTSAISYHFLSVQVLPDESRSIGGIIPEIFQTFNNKQNVLPIDKQLSM